MKIYLLGLPGSGKTTLGRELAKILKLSFIDLDQEIERSEGISIAEIFKKKKEDYFRRVESAQLKKIRADTDDFVMATGGGTPVFHENITIINTSGISVFLDVPARTISQRIIQSERNDRPLFSKTHPENLKDQIEFMRSQRISFYRQAHIIIGEDELSAAAIADRIKKEIQK